ncbi:MAG: hypothetical protein CMC28_02630 [Flavobacteriaceae bacterium]|nr:hypothetical protein [Flavobacteriaceae bacterium]
MINKIKFFFILIFFLSQSYSQKNELGIFIGGSNYVGDIGPTTFINPNDIIGGLLYKKNLNTRIALRGSVSYGNLYSNNLLPNTSSSRRINSRNFENKFTNFNIGVEFNFKEFDTEDSSKQFTFYVHSGLSYFINKFNKNNYLQPTASPISPPSILNKVNDFSLPISVGLKFKPFEKKITFGFEISANYSFTDDLDGSDEVIMKSNPSVGPFGGNLSNDWYFFSVFKITYIFGKHKCYCP